MTKTVWLASYPKSGNTWMRMLIGCLSVREGEAVDLNDMAEHGGIASARPPFDNLLLIDSGLLTHDEIDDLRPSLHEHMARLSEGDEDADAAIQSVCFSKAHDAYTLTARGEPLLGGARGADAAILIVRDPRAVAPSLANHLRTSIDAAIDFMNNPKATFAGLPHRQITQLRQKLLDWSGHAASWLDQRDIPVHLLRYEDLKRDTVGAFGAALKFAGVEVASDDVERAVVLSDFTNLQSLERQSGFSEWFDPSGGGRMFFRQGSADAWRDELTPEQIARIEAAHAPMMRRLGYTL